jgi:uncharacterized protein (DUF302 family)
MMKQQAMKYIVTTDKSVDQAVADLESAAAAQKFGVLHKYDLRAIMDSKGVDFDREVRVLEVCNPYHARTALDADMEANMALPCRISVWEEGGRNHIGMLRPTALLQAISTAPLQALATEVEQAMLKMIDSAR